MFFIDIPNPRSLFVKIILPMLSPIIKVQATLAIVVGLKQMETVYLSTGGGPGDATETIANYLYTTAFVSADYNYANTISIAFVLVCLLVTFITEKYIKANID